MQIQLDSRYQAFLEHSTERAVLGRSMPVAAVEDLLRGKVWACLDTSRRASKRQKDLADIVRLLESYPQLEPAVPAEIRQKLS